MSAIGREVYDAYERGLAKAAASERAEVIAALEALRDEAAENSSAGEFWLERAIDDLRSLSPLGLPTTEREQKK